jgi:hypothetical protein
MFLNSGMDTVSMAVEAESNLTKAGTAGASDPKAKTKKKTKSSQGKSKGGDKNKRKLPGMAATTAATARIHKNATTAATKKKRKTSPGGERDEGAHAIEVAAEDEFPMSPIASPLVSGKEEALTSPSSERIHKPRQCNGFEQKSKYAEDSNSDDFDSDFET